MFLGGRGEEESQSFSSDLHVHTEITGTDTDMPPSSGTGASENDIRQCVGFVNTIHFVFGLLLFGEGGLVSRLNPQTKAAFHRDSKHRGGLSSPPLAEQSSAG